MAAVFAGFEREILCERVRVGIAQARREGRFHGRPRTASMKAAVVIRLKAERVSHSEIARRLGIGRTSMRRVLAEGPSRFAVGLDTNEAPRLTRATLGP